MASSSELFCPAGTIYDPNNQTCTYSLSNIAAAQQQVVTASLTANRNPLQQGSNSFRSNPTTPPWVNMPDGGFPFSSNGTINLPAMGSGFQDVIGPNGQYPFQVPNGNDGVIKTLVCFYNGAGFISGSGQLIWRILQNGQAVRNYDNIIVALGGISPFPGTTEGIRIYSGDSMQFQVSNVGLNTLTNQISCFFGGWFYPSKLS